MRIDLPWYAPLLLALGTWLVYVADRILDGTRADPSTPLRERHRFHARHRKAFLTAGAAVGCALIWLIVARMSANARYEDTVLFSAALLYLVLVHKPGWAETTGCPKNSPSDSLRRRNRRPRLVPPQLRPPLRPPALFPAVAIFAAICWLNCVAIERWENLIPTGSARFARHPHHHPLGGRTLRVGGISDRYPRWNSRRDPRLPLQLRGPQLHAF